MTDTRIPEILIRHAIDLAPDGALRPSQGAALFEAVQQAAGGTLTTGDETALRNATNLVADGVLQDRTQICVCAVVRAFANQCDATSTLSETATAALQAVPLPQPMRAIASSAAEEETIQGLELALSAYRDGSAARATLFAQSLKAALGKLEPRLAEHDQVMGNSYRLRPPTPKTETNAHPRKLHRAATSLATRTGNPTRHPGDGRDLTGLPNAVMRSRLSSG